MVGLDPSAIANLLNLPSKAIEAEVQAKLAECREKLQRHFPNDKLCEPKVIYDLRGSTAGWAIADHTIRLNLDLLNDAATHDEMINVVLPHEYAHSVVHQMYHGKDRGHGPYWQMTMINLGLKPDRTHSMKTKPARKVKRYFYTCNCSHVHRLSTTTHNRIQNGTRYYHCTICNGRLTWNGTHS